LKTTQAFTIPSVPTNVDKYRSYVSLFRTLDLQAIDESLSTVMQNDFVQSRKEDTKIQVDDFHLWLTLARFQALSFGEDKLTQERWKYTLLKEKERRQRL
jgi:hypothetical protein